MWLRAVPQLHEPRGTVSLTMKFSPASDPAGAKSKENQETGYVKLRVVDGEKILAEGKQEFVSRESGNRRDISSPDGGNRRDIPSPDGGNMQEQQWTCGIEDIRLWDNHDPYLYELQIEVYGSDGTLLEYIPWRFGFRKIELTAGSGADTKVMYLNGKRLVINGVNRHEWSAVSGRCITEKEEAWDMGCLKQNNINAVRTCHYPGPAEAGTPSAMRTGSMLWRRLIWRHTVPGRSWGGWSLPGMCREVTKSGRLP